MVAKDAQIGLPARLVKFWTPNNISFSHRKQGAIKAMQRDKYLGIDRTYELHDHPEGYMCGAHCELDFHLED